MAVSTYEGVVERGQIRLCDDVSLPENARVYVVVLEAAAVSKTHIYSPRLADSEQAAQFTKQVIGTADAEL